VNSSTVAANAAETALPSTSQVISLQAVIPKQLLKQQQRQQTDCDLPPSLLGVVPPAAVVAVAVPPTQCTKMTNHLSGHDSSLPQQLQQILQQKLGELEQARYHHTTTTTQLHPLAAARSPHHISHDNESSSPPPAPPPPLTPQIRPLTSLQFTSLLPAVSPPTHTVAPPPPALLLRQLLNNSVDSGGHGRPSQQQLSQIDEVHHITTSSVATSSPTQTLSTEATIMEAGTQRIDLSRDQNRIDEAINSSAEDEKSQALLRVEIIRRVVDPSLNNVDLQSVLAFLMQMHRDSSAGT
jgi:hypothetical protein